MRVLKFGGSSVGSVESITKVVEIIVNKLDATRRCVVVFSAMKGVTDLLIEGGKLAELGDESFRNVVKDLESRHIQAIRDLLPVASQTSILSATKVQLNELESLYESVSNLRELSPRSLDRIVSFGELMISKIIAAKFSTLRIESVWQDSRELIRTDSNFGAAMVDFEVTNEQIRGAFTSENATVVVLPGFIGSDANGYTTTLGRGGGDYSAAIFAAALDSDALEIWTDVSGMMTADPRMVRKVGKIPQITYNEAMELSHFGAKVIYPPTLQPVRRKGIPVYVKNTFQPNDEGTVISAEAKSNNGIIRGITSIDGIAVLSLEGSGMVGIPGFSKRLFDVLSQNKINVVLITQASSEHSICVAIEAKFAEL
ncbi:MAG TPA: aspartate kinase, partial [Pyrinomonadaceae bacterium]|nr:aspartate kinase [Pyrinomonadaceae bacterium]